MDSFSLHFASGLWWLCAAALLAGIGLSIWTYKRTVPQTTPSRRRLLITLRSIGLALLVFVLFQPIVTLTKTQDRSPRIAVLIDNSRSMILPASVSDTSITRLAVLKQTLQSVFPQDVLSNRNALSLEIFSEKPLQLDTTLTSLIASLKANGAVTDISASIAALGELQKNENIGAAVLFSDGAYTAGSNPVYAAEHLGIPIFTVGIGDSTERRDISIVNVFTNEVATVGVAQPVDIAIHSVGVREGEIVTVSLFAENEKIDEEQIALKANSADEQVSFTYIPKQEGAVKLTARVAAVAGEATAVNNIHINYIKVLKNTFKIVLFAGAPSSDVSFIKDYYNGRKEIELSTFIQKQGAEFYEGVPTYDKVKNADLVILCGFPISSSSSESIALVKRLVSIDGHSLLFVPSRTIDLGKLKTIEDILPFTISASQVSTSELTVSASVSAQNLSNPILRADKVQTAAPKWETLAPLVKTETHFAPKAESDILAEATLQGVKIGEPLLLSRTVGKSRQVAFTAYGLWKWKLTSFGRERAFASLSRTKDSSQVGSESALDIFLGNATRWLVMRDDNKRVRIEPTQKLYDAGESINFTAQVYDESFVPIDEAIVSAKITGSSLSTPMEITLEPLSNGRYAAKLPQGLGKGEYSYSGTATSNNKLIGSDGGRFNVGEYSIEFAEPRMRSDILRQIAERSGGTFYTPQTDASLMSDIKHVASFAPKRIEEKSEYEGRMSWYILGLAIAFFSTEWFLRKRLGML